MKLEIEIGDKRRLLDLARTHQGLEGTLDGRPLRANAVELSPGVYSILIGSQAFEVRVVPQADGLQVQAGGREYSLRIIDPRKWRRGRRAELQGERHRQIAAPMPGKVIRVLVKPGDEVKAGDGLVVVEAMKMQNEVRSPKSGVVEKIVVVEGQTVNAGDPLGFIV